MTAAAWFDIAVEALKYERTEEAQAALAASYRARVEERTQ